MSFIIHPCKSLCFPNCTKLVKDITIFSDTFLKKPHNNPTKHLFLTPPKLCSLVLYNPHASIISKKDSILGDTHFIFCSRNDGFHGFSSDLSREAKGDGTQELERLKLLNKPSSVCVIEAGSYFEVETVQEKPSKEEALAPFLKFFKGNDYVEDDEENGEELGVFEEKGDDMSIENAKESKKVNVEYYEPKLGDFSSEE